MSATKHMKPLEGIRVIDMTRLAPGPYGTMLLADLGAEVIVVGGGRAGPPVSTFARGKQFITLDLKSDEGRLALVRLCDSADVFIEGFRPGVAERLGAGYTTLSASNPRLVYCSLTGYGQTGPRAQEAGHDLNYLGYTGVLGALGPADGPPQVPLNAIADMAGGGMLAVIGILAALQERHRSGFGQHVDAAMIDGCMSLIAMHYPAWQTAAMPRRGDGWLAGTAPNYRCYRCADGGYMAVGSLEPQFFRALWKTLALGEPVPDAMSHSAWPAIERTLEATFRTLPRDAWVARFEGVDACVTPVLSPDEAWQDAQVRTRVDPARPKEVPAVPAFSRSTIAPAPLDLDDHSVEVLAALGFAAMDIDKASPPAQRGVQDGLAWPPRFTD